MTWLLTVSAFSACLVVLFNPRDYHHPVVKSKEDVFIHSGNCESMDMCQQFHRLIRVEEG